MSEEPDPKIENVPPHAEKPPDSPFAALWLTIWKSRWRVPATIVILIVVALFAIWSSLPDDRKGKIIAYLLPSSECRTLNGQLVARLPDPDSSPNQCNLRWRHDEKQSLPEIFLKANQGFTTFVEQIFAGGDPEGTRVSYVLAPAAQGKSFIWRELSREHSSLGVFALKNCNYQSQVVPTLKPDSESGPVLGSHKKFDIPNGQTLVQFLNACRGSMPLVTTIPQFVAIDGLDEVHPETAREITLLALNHMKAVQTKKGSNPAHIFLIGRPEGFIAFFRDPRGERIVNCKRFELAGPIFDSPESIASRVEEYRVFMREKNGLALPDTSDKVERLLRGHSWACDSMANLDLGNIIIANADSYEKKLLDTSGSGAFEVRDLLFQELLARNAATHQRPDSNHDLYLRLLETIAVKYAHKLDEDGYFLVGARDTVTVDKNANNHADGSTTFLVTDMLNFSGLVYLSPADYANASRYQMVPAWLFQHLIEKHNDRINKAIVEQGCKR